MLDLGGEVSMGLNVQKLLLQVAENVDGAAVERCGHFVAEERPDYLLEKLFEMFDVQG